MRSLFAEMLDVFIFSFFKSGQTLQGERRLQVSMERRGRRRQRGLLSSPGPPTASGVSTEKPANERVTVTGSTLSTVCQRKVQMKESIQTGLPARKVASYKNMLNDSVEAFDFVPALARR